MSQVNLSFSLPQQFGVKMYVDGLECEMYAETGRLSDVLLDLFSKGEDSTVSIVLYDAPEKEDRNPLYISFTEHGMDIKCQKFARDFPLTYEEFKAAFLAHLEKYAIYFVAPYNYQAIMLLPFDEMVEKMKKREPQAKELIERICKCKEK